MYQLNHGIKDPTAHITINRGRLKTYGDKVYLKDGSTFEIELHNPTQQSVLAKIFLNGTEISLGGLVIKPGQRVYLERFVDDSKKFVFNTYEVENTKEAKAAIAQNGALTVYFYQEIFRNYDPLPKYSRINVSRPTWDQGLFTLTTNGGWAGSGLKTFASSDNVHYSSNVGTYATNSFFSNSTTQSSTSMNIGGSNITNTSSIETGRVEKGANSHQVFETVNGDFSSLCMASSSWQILPESSKPVEASEIRSYCTKCGTKQKKTSWKFCPTCGTPVNE